MSDSAKTPQPGVEVAHEEQLDVSKANDLDTQVKQDEKVNEAIGSVEDDVPPVVGRSVAFPPTEVDLGVEDKPTGGLNHPRGVEMRREMTVEDRELAQAGYDHLEEQKVVAAKDGEDELDKVDIAEHRLKFDELENALETSMITKEPSQSRGLELKEVAERLARDGKNILTPPKKKSAFRKVRSPLPEADDVLKDIS